MAGPRQNPIWNLVAGEFGAEHFQNLGDFVGWMWRHLHKGDRAETELGVCYWNNNSLFYRRIFTQYSFDLFRLNVLPSGDKQIVPSTKESEIPIIIDPPKIPRRKPPIAIEWFFHSETS